MSAVLQDLSPLALAAAIEANQVASWADCGRLPGGEVHDDPEALWVVSGRPIALFNGVFRAHLPADRLDDAVATLLGRFRARNLPMHWWVGPSTRPAKLGERLLAHGCRHLGEASGMAVDLLALPEAAPGPPGVAVAEVGDEEGLAEWVRIVAAGFEFGDVAAAGDALFAIFAGVGLDGEGMRRYRFFIAREAGVPVAASALYLAEGVAGVGWVATVPAARRRGFGTAVTVAPLRAARAAGYRVGVLWASPMGRLVYRRLGFPEYCTIAVYHWSPE